MIRFLILPLFLACAGQQVIPDPQKEVPVSVEFRLAAGEVMHVTGTGLTVRFVRLVSDSRCPANVTCIWEGDAEIEVELDLRGERSLARLHTHGGAQHPTEKSVSGYRVRLVGLGPSPENPPRAESEFVATLVVEDEARTSDKARTPNRGT